MQANTNNSEYEPLIGSNTTNYINVNLKTLSESYRYPLKCILFSIILITIIVVIIYGLSQENMNNPTIAWIQMEQQHTNLDHIPSSWTEKEECNDDHPFVLTLALKEENTHLLDEHIDKVSNPENSETFHKYWSVDEIRSYFKPSAETLDIVIEWLSSNGFTAENGKLNMFTSNGNIIKVSLTCGDANNLLNAKYLFYEHRESHKTRLRVKDGIYNIPSYVYDHIDFISPTIRFPLESHTKSINRISKGKVEALKKKDNQNEYNIPQRLYSLYSMNSVVSEIIDHNMNDRVCRQSIASFIEQFYSDSDLNLFWETFDIYPQSEMERVPINQGEGDGDEAELDTQYITAMGMGIYTYDYYINDDEDPFVNLVEAIWNTDIIPSVLSISYGADENEMGLKYVTRCNQEFGKLALAGTTILASSGDDGVRGNDEDCYNGWNTEDDISSNNNGKKWGISDDYTFVATFPASSPYVTSVGGTEGGIIQKDIDDVTGEIAWLYSGGGFSEYTEAPKWQKNAIRKYFENKDIAFPDTSRYSSSGRGYPDISAQSVDFVVAKDGEWTVVGGTSCSSPTVAGMISMINYARTKDGKSSLGFINPIIYSLYDDNDVDYNYYFNDIVEGYNIGCQQDNDIGFYTANGWDPVTGFGTPKFQRLYQKLIAID